MHRWMIERPVRRALVVVRAHALAEEQGEQRRECPELQPPEAPPAEIPEVPEVGRAVEQPGDRDAHGVPPRPERGPHERDGADRARHGKKRRAKAHRAIRVRNGTCAVKHGVAGEDGGSEQAASFHGDLRIRLYGRAPRKIPWEARSFGSERSPLDPAKSPENHAFGSERSAGSRGYRWLRCGDGDDNEINVDFALGARRLRPRAWSGRLPLGSR